ncbi:unnamed protein product [Arabidopsis thaliana]|uniref:Uncharacterized protein n=2 Tax=Arabidopsis thaliana TaxID=3702 RepID=A0A654FZ49_ARATH|nr:uncharacterized protein AT5G07545 [Arabidopsis thaliana]ANM71184.1 hypothetical protein AT5G07545 [Arabidopsis thaliana]CAA0401274.1 unnamed protein product [Arabidopsis thaliana]VYS66172.1 unnamed protein product [Arabidopsis thaliana]|eukprot:NP_001336536.1 hypothetical protein AT5G07545 [Arabidopsis thaliana]
MIFETCSFFYGN